MKNKIYFIAFIIILTSCNSSRTKNVERISTIPEIIISDLETIMPGQLVYVSSDYLLWTDPFNYEFGVHIIDLKKKKEIVQAVPRGDGPEEIINPNISPLSENSFFAYDPNSNKFFIFGIDGSLQRKLKWKDEHFKYTTSIIPFENNLFITLSPAKKEHFSLVDSAGVIIEKFGQIINEDIENKFEVYQGEIAFNPNNGFFVYTTFLFPSINRFHKNDHGFMSNDKSMIINSFDIIGNRLEYDRTKNGIFELTLTKDYIVTLERDYYTDPIDESTVGRDFEKLPQTIFLYDYDLILKRIVNIGIPIMRLASDPSSNEIYAIGINPDFTIVKIII